MSRRIGYNIERIVENARTLSDPDIAECFYCYDISCEVDEINEIQSMLPKGICVGNLPSVLCGNKRTKIFGYATCNATQGHLILDEDTDDRVMFADEEEAVSNGFRPCGKCMQKEYRKWMNERKGDYK